VTRVLKIMPFALLGLAVAVSGCNRGEAAQTDGQAETALVTRRSLLVQAEAAGEIEPIRVIEVKSKASGEVLTLSFETGDYVERGTLLATIDPRDVQNAFDQAQADLAVAEARAQTSEAQRQRTEELRAANVVTAQELESAQLDVANQQASLIRARTNLTLARERLNDVRITAPLTGTVIEKTVEIGQIIASATGNVSGGTTLLKMADLSQMQVRSLIDETDLAQMRAGLPVQVTVDAYPDRRFNGQVLKIEPQAVIEQNVTSFPVLVMLDNSEGLLKPGMNADVVIEIATRQNVLVVPNAAVVGTQDAVAAGAVLGLSEDEVNAGLSARPAAPPPTQPAAGDSAARPAAGDSAARGAAPTGAEDCTAIFRKIRESGGADNLNAADRAKLEACRGQMSGMAGGRGGRGGQGGQGGQGGRGGRGGLQNGVEQRPGVVFVADSAGNFTARRITLGLNDFDYAEVVRGLNEGDKVVMISVARLQQQQQQFLDRMRERTSSQGPIPGSGGGPGMGGGGGRGR
jgi:HlyD family secretion protein